VRKDPQQARSHVTVDAILDAAARILGERGWRGLTTNAAAEVAGVSIGSVYQDFPDKRAIFAALHVRGRGGPQLRITDCRRPHNPELLTFYGVAAKSSATTRASMPHTGKRD
jgi:AcrR family transcriptional regulator